MTQARRARWPVVITLLFAQEAHVARMADIAEQTFTYQGAAADQLAALLELRSSQETRTFPLSQMAEGRAMPTRDAALRDARGTLPPDLDQRASGVVSVTATRTSTGLTLKGWMLDGTTALPMQAGPRFSFQSPSVVEAELRTLPAWSVLYEKLRGLPVRHHGLATVRELDVALGDGERAMLQLFTRREEGVAGHTTERHVVLVAVGQVLVAPAPPRRPSR